MAYGGLYAVFESLERAALLSLLRSELPKHQLFRMTCPIHPSQLFMIMASMLVDSAMSRTCRLETRSCPLMFRMVRRLRIWKRSSCFRFLLLRSMSLNHRAGW